MAVINWAIGILPSYFRKLVSCDCFGGHTLHQQHRKRTNPQLTYSRAGENLLVLWANSSLIFLAWGHFLPAPWTELNNNNNNNNDNNNNNNNNNNSGLLTDPLGGSSLLKYINCN